MSSGLVTLLACGGSVYGLGKKFGGLISVGSFAKNLPYLLSGQPQIKQSKSSAAALSSFSCSLTMYFVWPFGLITLSGSMSRKSAHTFSCK